MKKTASLPGIEIFPKNWRKLGGDNTREAFLLYSWPGNVRELKNLIERFVVLSTDPVITYDDLPSVMKDCLLRKGSWIYPYTHWNLVLRRNWQLLNVVSSPIVWPSSSITGRIARERGRVIIVSFFYNICS